jgi:hypothetical protein
VKARHYPSLVANAPEIVEIDAVNAMRRELLRWPLGGQERLEARWQQISLDASEIDDEEIAMQPRIEYALGVLPVRLG